MFDWSNSDDRRFALLISFLVLVFLTGGGSRNDVQSLAILQPLAFIFAAAALIVAGKQQLKRLGLPLTLLAVLAAIVLLQLIPLPPTIWHMLPGREPIIASGELLGLDNVWRPISLSPASTWSSLFFLAIPLAAMILFAIQSRLHQRRLIGFFIGIALASSILAILQLSSPEGSVFYLYRVTNDGAAVGLFANRNHHAMYLACAILMAFWYAASLDKADKHMAIKGVFAAVSLMVFLPMIFVIGSRAGLLLGFVCIVLGFYFILRSELFGKSRFLSWMPDSKFGVAIPIALLLGFSLMAIATQMTDNATALDRLIGQNSIDELRISLLPTLLEMVNEFWVIGAGFGSFELVYKSFEPQSLLSTKYLNMAHNDLVQLIVEAGLAGILLIVIFAIWLITKSIDIAKSSTPKRPSRQLMSLLLILIWGIASLFDYPMRVPSLA
ncbi:MAG: O-antigen ligase family protein, partial [Lentilitoribacter sp.]